MQNDGHFDQKTAATYDVVHQTSDAELNRVADVLSGLCNGGAALEFAIGTGRIAIPLAERGIQVSGIEISAAMAGVLAKKPAGRGIEVTVGDMTATKIAQEFGLVYLVYNTIDNLTSQDAQIACFNNASAHLKKRGRFLIETLVPPLQRLPMGETLLAFNRTDEHWGIDEFDVVSQNYASHHLRKTEDGHITKTVPFRYAWPAELDLMAKLAGMSLVSRWADWDKSPFAATSTKHISVWEKP